MLRTGLCEQFGTDLPIWNAGMGGGLAGVDLAAAVANAGGLGVLGMGGLPAPVIREHVQQVRSLTDRPFGVNLIMPLMDDAALQCCLDERVPVLILFWGDAGPYVDRAHAIGTKIVVQVGTVAQARAAAAAGVDAVMVQGFEAGGHNRASTPLSVLLPAVVDAVGPLPVIAAGGIADARGVVAALALGAQAVSLGTRFLCSNESRADAGYKELVVRATAEDTVHTRLFDLEWPDAPHRVLRNRVVTTWEAAGSPASGARPGEGKAVGRMPVAGQVVELLRYSIFMPMEGFEGDLDDQVLYAGQSCALIDSVEPAAEIVRTLAAGAEALLKNLAG